MTRETGAVAPGFRRLFEPLVIGNFEVRNRILNATHGTALPEARDLRYLQERARGGAARTPSWRSDATRASHDARVRRRGARSARSAAPLTRSG